MSLLRVFLPQVKKPSLEDAMAGAFMAGADFVPPKKQKHKPLIKFLGKRSLLREQNVGLQQRSLQALSRGLPACAKPLLSIAALKC